LSGGLLQEMLATVIERHPRTVARELGLAVEPDGGLAHSGETLLVAAWEADRRIVRLYTNGITALAERDGRATDDVAREALAHEVLHAWAADRRLELSEEVVREWAARWAAGHTNGS
jgi:hypothetical protein